jgi:hypothetical protein
VAPAAARFGPDAVATGRLATTAMEELALGCRRIWRLVYRRGAWTAGVALGAATVTVTLPAGLLGPFAIAVCAVLVGLPVRLVWWWLVWKACRRRRPAGGAAEAGGFAWPAG